MYRFVNALAMKALYSTVRKILVAGDWQLKPGKLGLIPGSYYLFALLSFCLNLFNPIPTYTNAPYIADIVATPLCNPSVTTFGHAVSEILL